MAQTVTPSGSFQYTIPIEVAPGRGGMEPQIALSYDSNAGDGPVGPGWQVTGFSQIYRCPTTVATHGKAGPIDFEDSHETGLCLDGSPLVFVKREGSALYWRTETESFREIVSLPVAGVTGLFGKFLVRDNAGRTFTYGSLKETSLDVAQFEPGTKKRVWALERVEDLNHNWIQYGYHTYWESSAPGFPRVFLAPGQVVYGAEDRRVVFNYDEREDFQTRFIAGNWTRALARLRSIDVVAPGNKGRRYRLEYSDHPEDFAPYVRTAWSQLEAVYQCGVVNGVESCLAPIEFEYNKPSRQTEESPDQYEVLGENGVRMLAKASDAFALNANGDGYEDIYHPGKKGLSVGTGNRAAPFVNKGIAPFPEWVPSMTIGSDRFSVPGYHGCDNSRGIIDLDKDGRQELLDTCGEIQGSTWKSKIYGYSDVGGWSTERLIELALPPIDLSRVDVPGIFGPVGGLGNAFDGPVVGHLVV